VAVCPHGDRSGSSQTGRWAPAANSISIGRMRIAGAVDASTASALIKPLAKSRRRRWYPRDSVHTDRGAFAGRCGGLQLVAYLPEASAICRASFAPSRTAAPGRRQIATKIENKTPTRTRKLIRSCRAKTIGSSSTWCLRAITSSLDNQYINTGTTSQSICGCR